MAQDLQRKYTVINENGEKVLLNADKVDADLDNFVNGFSATPQKIRVATKEGKTGTIPASQLKKALSLGYTLYADTLSTDTPESKPQVQERIQDNVYTSETRDAVNDVQNKRKGVLGSLGEALRGVSDSTGTMTAESLDRTLDNAALTKDITEGANVEYTPEMIDTQKQHRELSDRVNAELRKRTEELLNQEYETSKKLQESDKLLERAAGFYNPDPYGRSRAKQLNDDRHKNLSAAKNMLDDSDKVIDAVNALADGEMIVGQTFRGIKDGAFDFDTWSFGLTDLLDVSSLRKAAEKAERGEELTDDEEMLLDAAATDMAVNYYYASSLSRGYKAGKVTGESLPFMLEMAINPLSKSGDVLAKGMLKHIKKKALGRTVKDASGKIIKHGYKSALNNKTLKWGSQIVGDVAGAAGMTLTTGQASTLADAQKRMMGEATFNYDEDGNLKFAGMVGGEGSWLDAYGKAFGAKTIENYSEMLGEYFSPIFSTIGDVARKSISKIGLGNVLNNVENGIKKGLFGPSVRDFMKATRWDGVLSEFAEEQAGGILNALIVGDQTLDTDEDTGVFNKDNMIDTFLGVSILGGVMSTISTLGYRNPVTRAKQDLILADARAKKHFGEDKWQEIVTNVGNYDLSDIGEQHEASKIADEMDDDGKRLFWEYLGAEMKLNGVMLGERERKLFFAKDPMAKELEMIYDEYSEGITPENRNDLLHSEKIIASSPLSRQYKDTSVEELVEIYKANPNDEMAQYIKARQADLSYREYLKSQKGEAVRDYNNEISSMSFKGEGKEVREVALKNGIKGYILDETNDSITVVGEDGNKYIVSKSEIAAHQTRAKEELVKEFSDSYESGIDTHLNSLYSTPTDEEVVEQEIKLDNQITSLKPNDTVLLKQDDGTIVEGKVEQVDADNGLYWVKTKEGGIMQMSKEELESAIVPGNANEPKEDKGEGEQPKPAPMPKPQPPLGPNGGAPQQGGQIPPQTPQVPEEEVDELEGYYRDEEKKKVDYDKLLEEKPEVFIDVYGNKNGEDATISAIDVKIKAINEQIKKAEKAKSKKTSLNDIEDINDEIAEHNKKIETLEGLKKGVIQRKAQADAEKAKQEAIQAGGKQTEITFGEVPDVSEDKSSDARERGFRVSEGVRIDRQEPIDKKEGKETNVSFATGKSQGGKFVLIDAKSATPSHINGKINLRHFLPEAQPKDRVDKASQSAREDIAKNINPGEITRGETAYSGSPVVNSRGEVIQGNGRTDALQYMYESFPEQAQKYKQFLIDNAAEFGLNPADIESMESPMLVRMVDVDDNIAIGLGQHTASDLESGGVQSLRSNEISNMLGNDLGNVSDMLLETEDEDASLSSVIGSNGKKALQYLLGRGIINNTQYQSAFNEEGELTSEAIESLRGVLQSALFTNAPDNIKKWFAKLPKSAQKALLQVAHRDMMSGESDRIMEDIQSAIQLYYQLSMDADFAKVKTVEDFDNYVKNLWGQQTNLFAEGVPIEKFSKFAVELAKHFKFKKEKELKAIYNELFDAIQGVENLFGDNAPLSKEEAIKKIFNIDYGTKEQSTTGATDEKGGSGVLVQDDTEGSSGGQGSKTGDTVTGGTKEEGQPSEPSGTSDGGSSEDVSGSAEEVGSKDKKDGKKEESEPTSIFDEAEEIAAEEEVKEEGEENAKDEQEIEITEELIDSLPLDEVIKTYAKLYLKGKQNKLTTESFNAVKNYVYNAQGQSGGVGSTANGTQLGGSTNATTGTNLGESGESDRSMDRGQGDGDVSEVRSSGENSEDNVLLPNGTRSDSGVESNPSVPSDAGSTLSGGRSDSGSTGDNVGKRGRPKGSRGVSKSDARGQAQTKPTTDESIASADSLIDEALTELEEILKEASSTLNAGFNPIILKVIPATAKLGYGLVKKGFYTFKKWYSQMQTSAGPLLRNAFSVEEIDELIRDMWDTEFTFNGETHTIQEWASIVEQEELRKMVKMSIEEKIKLQKSREDVETIISDLDNIRESLPFLLPKQQEDVQKAEVQFFSDEHKAKKYGNGKGILFTNGTGTGKTFTGLGIAKRFLKQGKGRILIVTAQDKKIKDWVRDAGYLGINATQLQDTKDKGKGVVVTQYANMYQNRALLEEEWDLIIYDESHKLMENKDGSETARSVMHYLLSNRDIEQAIRRMLRDHPLFKRELQLLGEIDKLEQDFKTLTSKTVSQYTKEERELYNKYQQDANNIRNLINSKKEEIDSLKTQQDKLVREKMNDKEVVEKAQAAVDKTKVVFLSASPFNTAKNLGYTESYIFSYDPDAEENPNDTLLPSEKKGRERDNFVLEKFPSSHQRMSNGKVITRSEAQIANPEQSSREEVTFSEALQEQGTLSGRMLDSEYDYSRQFPRLNFRLAAMFNEIYRNLLEGGRFAALGASDAFKPLIKEYASYTEYFEALKTYASIDRIKEHLALGRKVLIFHRRRSNTAGGGMVRRLLNECIESAKASGVEGIDQFAREYAEYLAWERTADLDFANYKIAEAFATEEEKAEYQKELKKWEQKCKIAEQNGKPMPSRPQWKNLKSVAIYSGALTEKEKQEGAAKFNDDNSGVRIMIAQVASAKEGVDFHDKTGKNQRVEINLFLPESPLEFIQTEGRIYRIGNKSNAVFEYPLLGIDLELSSFASKINGRAQTAENLALGTMARGLRYSIARAALSMREMPVGEQQGVGGKMLDDASQQNKTDFDSAIQNYNEWKENQAEELSQKQVPDPIGERMVTWGFSQGGETVFIPYAGEGTIARYANPATRLVAFENSTSRFARLMMLCGGAGRKIENRLFDGSGVSYCDNIFHFRPSKSAQKELDDLDLSWQRLADNGRMIFLTTTGTDFKGYWVNTAVRADIKLPTSLLGGEIRNLRIVVIDKQSNRDVLKEASANKVEIDLSDIQDEATLWEAIRGIQVPERAIDEIATIKKRVERVLNTHIANCGTIRKAKNYATGKMEPDVNSYNTSCSFRFKYLGSTYVNYVDFIGGTGLYVERYAKLYWQYKDYINKNKHSNDMRTTQKVEECQAWCQFCEALLGKTPTQIKNIALGLSENVVTGKIEVSELRDSIKGMLNGNAALDRLNDRVMKVAEQFGIEVEIVPSSNPIFSGRDRNTQGIYSAIGKKIWIKEEYINSSKTPNDKKAEVLLHETIHAVTSYALNAYEQGVLPKDSPLYQACADIKEVYESIKNDATFAASIRGANGIDALNNEYGLTNVHEMMAELANPMFRAALKAKNLWEQVINGIKKILGIKVIDEAKEVNALNVLENALDTLLDNADKATFDKYSDPRSMLFGKEEYEYNTISEEESETSQKIYFTPSEIAQMETPILKSKGTFKNLSEAEIWAKENLQGKSYVNRFTNDTISISGKSIKEMLNPNTTKKISESVHMAALMSVPEFIKTGIPAEQHKDTHDRGFDVIRLYNAIEIDEKVYRVKSTVKRLKEGDRYYTYEIQEMELIEDTHSTAVGLNGNPVLNSTNSITGANLLKNVKKTNSDEYILNEEDTSENHFRERTDPAPKKTGKGYKVFVLKDGKLYPPMVANPNGAETPVGIWLDADEAPIAGQSKTGRNQVKAGGKGTQGGSGTLAYRPGWHLGEIPYALQFNRKDEVSGERELFPANFVWAEVEYADDVDYQEEAMQSGVNKNGKFQHSLAGLQRSPKDGSYRYRTNPNPETDPWIITGAMKVNRILTPSEVDKMVIKAGREPQKRQKGAFTDKQIEQLNMELGLTDSKNDALQAEKDALSRELIKDRIQKHAEKIGIKVKFVSKEELPKGHKNAQGMFNPKTQEISICLDNHKSVDDAIVTLMHEAVGHYGLRKLIGDKNFDKFLWSVYENATEEVREKIVEITREKGFIGRDMTDAIEEYLSRLAEDTALYEQSKESGFFDKIKELFNNLLKKILGYGGEITDEDLRYLLIRSYDNLNNPNGKGGIFDTARDIAVKEKLGLSERDGVQYRTSSGSLHFREVEDEIKQSNYDKRLSEKSYKVQEAYQDSMLGLKVLQEEIEKESGKKLKDYENAYMFENTVSSRNRYEQDNFKVKYQLPMINAISKLMAKGFTYEDIKLYAMAKSGLERNDVFAMRDATKIYDEAVKELDGEIAQKMSEAERNLLDSGDNAKYQKEVDKIEKYRKNRLDTLEKQRQKNYEKFRGNDYSALTSLFEADSLSESEELAQEYVSKIENGNTAEIADFWDKVNAASDYSLKKNLNSGLLSQSMYDKISSIFNYYVPMRDFEEDTAEDLYDYYTQPMSKFNAPLKAAKGRTSEYKDPFATICNMADSAILQSHKNMMKQRFVAMALNNKGSKYLKVSNRWIVKTNEVDADGRPIWEEKLPEIPENATPEEITQILNDFEESMNTMKAEGNAQVVTSRTKLPFRVVKKAHISEHMVSAKIGGDIYNVYVLGNPRAAQAVNGLTNPATDNKVLQKIQKANRLVAANYTTMSPKFIMRNAMRDLLYSSFSINIKEDEEYGKLFRKNRTKMIFGEGYMFTLMRKFLNGTLDPNNETDKIFLEFMKNGGETGYSLLRDVEEFQKMNTDLLKQLNDNSVTNKIKNGGKAIIDGIEFTNRCVENLCRFTVYMTSRQYGRSIDKSITDAKNISVNFNKKGSGQGYGAGFFRHAYLFFNAGVQGLTNFISLAKSSPKKFAKRTAAWVGWGAVMPMVNTFISSLFGDDDDYWDLPEWIRRNNFCFKLPFGSNYVTIPLPIELRALYGIGETVGTALMGKAPHSNIAGDIIMQVLDVMPFNMLEGVNTSNESIGKTIAQNMMPDIIAPTVDAVIFNKDFTGRPIYKDYDYNRYDPEFTKAYKGTSRYLIQFTEFINRLSGGDKYTKGAVDLNPAVIEYMAEGYLGGRLTMLNEIAQTIGSIVEQDVEVRDIPFANIVLQHNDERTTSSYVNELYYYYKQEHDANVRRLNKYKKDPDMIDEYYELNDEYAFRREIYDKYQNSIDDMKKKMQKYQDNGDKDMAKYYQELIEEEKRTLVEMMLEFE